MTQDIAERLEDISQRFITFVSDIDDEAWSKTTDAEGWAVGVAAHHIAVGAQFVMDLAEHVAAGGEITWTKEFIDAANEQHADVFSDVSKVEALENVTYQLGEAVKRTRALSNGELTLPLADPWDYPYSERFLHNASDVIEVMIIDHIASHLGSIAKTTAKS